MLNDKCSFVYLHVLRDYSVIHLKKIQNAYFKNYFVHVSIPTFKLILLK